jgi:hypothetical protein
MANEHFKLTANTAKPCSLCHTTNYTVGTYSPAKTTVTSRITAKGDKCDGCHTTSTQATPHVQRQGITAAPGSTQFDSAWSGHAVFSLMGGSLTNFPSIAGATRSWSLPTVAGSWLKAPYDGAGGTSMAVRCNECHGSASGATGPHGSSVTVNIASGYNNNYSSGGAYLSATGMQGNPICAKCHQTGTSFLSVNAVHTQSNHQGATNGRCVNCHSRTPHAWKRPRLLGYTTDSTPFGSNRVTTFSVPSGTRTPGSWIIDDCSMASGCHGNRSHTAWP